MNEISNFSSTSHLDLTDDPLEAVPTRWALVSVRRESAVTARIAHFAWLVATVASSIAVILIALASASFRP
jgi:uncharacterized protein (DUF2237 family)